MWQGVELQEIRVFLTLAAELDVRCCAERLGLAPTKVSRSLDDLECKLGQPLVDRTSGPVTLTPVGEKFRALLGPVCNQLDDVLERIHTDSRRLEGTLRLGFVALPLGGPHLMAVVERFTALHPDCDVDFREVTLGDFLGPLRRGEIDVMASRLPIEQPDLAVGPVLSSEPRVLAVTRRHPLAHRSQVSIEDLADYKVGWFDKVPKEMEADFIPFETPSGRPIERLRRPIRNFGELAMLVARGDIVHPTVSSTSAYWGYPTVVYIPITDMPESTSGMVWLRRNLDPKVREFVRLATDTYC